MHTQFHLCPCFENCVYISLFTSPRSWENQIPSTQERTRCLHCDTGWDPQVPRGRTSPLLLLLPAIPGHTGSSSSSDLRGMEADRQWVLVQWHGWLKFLCVSILCKIVFFINDNYKSLSYDFLITSFPKSLETLLKYLFLCSEVQVLPILLFILLRETAPPKSIVFKNIKFYLGGKRNFLPSFCNQASFMKTICGMKI